MLDNKAKISDIIASLQESEGINQKAELKSILVDKGITAEDIDDMASIVDKVNELVKLSDTCVPTNIKKDININGIIGTLDIESLGGKRWASGTLQSSNSGSSFVFANGIHGSAYNAECTSLTFTPSIIILYREADFVLYNNNNYFVSSYPLGVIAMITGFGGSSNGSTTRNYQLSDPASIGGTGFNLPVYLGNVSYSWVAVE